MPGNVIRTVLHATLTNKNTKKRHSAEQIIRILGEIENSGLKVSDACCPHAISEQTYCKRSAGHPFPDLRER